MSVTAKSVSLKICKILLSKSFFVDTKSQFFDPFHKILVSLIFDTLNDLSYNFKPSTSIASNEIVEFLY